MEEIIENRNGRKGGGGEGKTVREQWASGDTYKRYGEGGWGGGREREGVYV